jgi:hypothetical protein
VQQPSSLIFLAIVVIWAAYLLQHWIRRREALATARSVDQFSDAMRVLERREHRVEIDGIATQISEAPHASRSSAPQARSSAPRPSLRAGTVMTGETQPTVTGPTSERTASATNPALQEGRTESALRRFGRTAATAGSPKLRAIALIASLSVLLITVVCAAFGALPWWSPVLMLAVSGGAFYWCRISAMASAAAHRPAAARAAQSAPGHAKAAARLPKRATGAPVPVTKATMTAPAAATAAPQPVEQVFDVRASAPESAPAVQSHPAPVRAAAESEGAWRPVAVPPPTYKMKERAPERRRPAPVPTASARSYQDVANEDLPFDGLALDQDLDDLPSVFRAG